MRIAYLVLAHGNPSVLERSVKRLTASDCAFFIHVDQKSRIEEFSGIRGENVFFSGTRIPVYWGEFSQVEAVLLVMRQALQYAERFDYFVLLSGSDYPLRSSQYIHKFLEDNRGTEFISMVKVPNSAAGKPISRINTLRIPSSKPVRRFLLRGLAKLGLARRDYRKFLGTLEPYAGSTWWALTREACEYIMEFVNRNQRVIQFFENVFAADEALFHTILGNSKFQTQIRRNLVYDDWSQGGAHPTIIDEVHLAQFESQDKVLIDDVYGPGEVLFARKFSAERLHLVQRIDEMIAQG